MKCILTRALLISTVLIFISGLSSAEESEQPLRELSYTDAIILGLVEGITEYLPVSSTGHLILTNAALGLDADEPVYDKSGQVILIETDDGVGTRPYTLGEAAFDYVIVIQAGAIAAVIILYWKSIVNIIMGCIGVSAKGRRLAINLAAAFLPAAVLGLLLNDLVEDLLGDNIHAVAGALVVGAIIMLLVERWRKRGSKESAPSEDGPTIYDLPVRKAFMIGCFQCVAMWPGTSRSMATIVGGYIAGLSPARAAEFSFLLGLITLSAASGYTLLKDGSEMFRALSAGPVLAGCLVAFVSSALAIKWLVSYLSKHGLGLFAWYRIGLAILVLLFLA